MLLFVSAQLQIAPIPYSGTPFLIFSARLNTIETSPCQGLITNCSDFAKHVDPIDRCESMR
jgi:hypothetical protein